LANFSPGFAWKPWVIVVGNEFFATLKSLSAYLSCRALDSPSGAGEQFLGTIADDGQVAGVS
jgi:hypothetical protein